MASTSQQRVLEPPTKKQKIDIQSDNFVVFKNPPALTTTFTDPETKEKKVAVCVQLFNGVKGAEFDIVTENGEQFVQTEYNWPTFMSSNQIFKKTNDDSNGEDQWLFPPMHPMVIAFESSLNSYRANIDEIPIGFIKVQLPIEVKTDSQTLSTLSDGAVIFFLLFVSKEDTYTVNKQQKNVSFA